MLLTINSLLFVFSSVVTIVRRFLELGSRAVDVALCVGIFPYVLKLLQSPAPELRRPLVAIWAAILAFDGSCRSDLARDGDEIPPERRDERRRGARAARGRRAP